MEFIAKLGWTVPMDMPFPDLQAIVMQDDLTTEQLDHCFIEYYKRDDSVELTRLKKRLLSSDQLKPWDPLIEQCVQAFDRADFAICVPSLLLIFEGSIVRRWGVRFQTRKDRLRFFHDKIASAHPKSMQWKSLAAFADSIFEEALKESRKYSLPKRHLILHGKSDPATWDEADCLRLFQAVSSALSLLELVSEA